MNVRCEGGVARSSQARWLISAVVLLLAAAWFLVAWLARDDRSVAAEPRGAAARQATPATAFEEGGVEVVAGNSFDLGYGVEGGDITRDLETVHDILLEARMLVKDFGRHPLADNRDITSFLSGRNPHRVAWIRPGHPMVNRAGELTDRFGSPLFFHRESATLTTIRSAGPDRRMWNVDDMEMSEEQFQQRRAMELAAPPPR